MAHTPHATMIVRPDWLRRKHLVSAVLIAATLVLLISSSDDSKVILDLRSGGTNRDRAASTWPEGRATWHGAPNMAYDPWQPYSESSPKSWGNRNH